MARVRLLVEATCLPGSARDGERATWCKDYTRAQAEKLIRIWSNGDQARIRNAGVDYQVSIDTLIEVDPRDLAEQAWRPATLSPIGWAHTDPEHLS